jgi:ATP-dependent DNA helicase DinG
VSFDDLEDRRAPAKERQADRDRSEDDDSPRAEIKMKDVFGPGGLLERSMIGGYEHRPAQLEMAEVVHDAFQTRHHAIVEAGTGTGKTLAYLLPAICSGRRVVISTATKSLQEQLYQKDIPFLQKHFAPHLKVAVMKGRSNFL